MSEKNGEKTNGNVIKGPWTTEKEIVSEDELDATKALKLAFAEALTQQIVVQMIYSMGKNDVDVGDENFVYDVGLIIELIKGSIYRGMGIPHPTHAFFEALVDLTIDENKNIHSQIDLNIFEKFAELTEYFKDDDDPEISKDDDDPEIS